MTPGPGIEPGPHWWKASALTTAPSLLPPLLLRATSGARNPNLNISYKRMRGSYIALHDALH